MNTQYNDPDSEDTRLDALLAAARADRLDTSRAEYGFETRLSSRLSVLDAGMSTWWAVWSWRLAPLFAVIALSLSLWTHYTPAPVAADDRMLSEWSSAANDDLGVWLLNDDLPPS